MSLRFAAERRAALCVCDRRRRDARNEKQPGPDAKTTSTRKRKPNDLVRDSFGEADRVEWQLTAGASRANNGKDDPWWFADGVVVLVTAANAEAREQNTSVVRPRATAASSQRTPSVLGPAAPFANVPLIGSADHRRSSARRSPRATSLEGSHVRADISSLLVV